MSGGSILLDQVYLDNTQAHVFISDKSNITNWLTYSSTAHNEVQVASAWSNSSITITLNQGTFTQGTTAYLYVVDSNGNISRGAGSLLAAAVAVVVLLHLLHPLQVGFRSQTKVLKLIII